MTSIQSARGIIADTEKALRELMQHEIEEHRYGDIAELARLADGVARLLRSQSDTAPASPARTPIRKRPTATPKRASSAKPKDYPRFERDGAKLIKVGWSKKAREEYEHRAPRDAVAAFVQHLATKVAPGTSFVMEDLMPVPDSAGGEVPSYQVYMTLAWLRQVGAIQKKGRDGYILGDTPVSGSGLDELWDQTPSRS